MQHKSPWKLLLPIITIVGISLSGAYVLYRIISAQYAPSDLQRAAIPRSKEEVVASQPPLSVVDKKGYFVLGLRSVVALSAEDATPTFELALDNLGFQFDCPGKVVVTDYRSQSQDYWTDTEGASAQTGAVVCLEGTSTTRLSDFNPDASPLIIRLDEEQAETYRPDIFEGRGKAAYVQTGHAGYVVYVGTIYGRDCSAECIAGTAAGISVTRVNRPLLEDRFVFSLPLSESETVDIVGALPVVK